MQAVDYPLRIAIDGCPQRDDQGRKNKLTFSNTHTYVLLLLLIFALYCNAGHSSDPAGPTLYPRL